MALNLTKRQKQSANFIIKLALPRGSTYIQILNTEILINLFCRIDYISRTRTWASLPLIIPLVTQRAHASSIISVRLGFGIPARRSGILRYLLYEYEYSTDQETLYIYINSYSNWMLMYSYRDTVPIWMGRVSAGSQGSGKHGLCRWIGNIAYYIRILINMNLTR